MGGPTATIPTDPEVWPKALVMLLEMLTKMSIKLLIYIVLAGC